MKPITTGVALTDEILLTLDGCGDDKVQAEVEKAKTRKQAASELGDLTESQVAFIVSVEEEAKKAGKLIYTYKQIRHCGICKKSLSYAKFKSGPRKGRDNTDRPLLLGGVELAQRFVTMSGYATLGGCKECIEAIKPYLLPRLTKIPAQYPKALIGDAPNYTRHDIMRCKKCGWEGSEHLMGKLPAVMGGHYYGKCPKCDAENRLFSTQIEKASGFHLEPEKP